MVAFDHAYHGRTNLTMALTAKAMPYKAGFGPFAGEVYRAPMSYPYRDGLSGPEAAHARDHRDREADRRADLAAVIIEPVQGEGGFVVPAEGFLPALQAWCTANGVVFIVDEIQSGFARTGDLFASEHEGLVPDLITTAKGIAGGLPLSAVTGRAEIMDAPHAGGLGGTYAGNPVACAAALASLDHFEHGGLVERAREIGTLLLDRLQRRPGRRPADRRRPRPRCDGRHRARRPRHRRPRRGADRRGRQADRERGRDRPDLRHVRQRHPPAAPAEPSTTTCCREGLDVLLGALAAS